MPRAAASSPTVAGLLAELQSLGTPAIKNIFLNHGAKEPIFGVKIEDLKKVEKELGAVETKLSNPSFVERAPEAVVEKSKRDASQLREKRERLEAALNSL